MFPSEAVFKKRNEFNTGPVERGFFGTEGKTVISSSVAGFSNLKPFCTNND